MKTKEQWQEELNGETSLKSIESIQKDAYLKAINDAVKVINDARGEGESDLRCIRARVQCLLDEQFK